jgi:hypothetical protein
MLNSSNTDFPTEFLNVDLDLESTEDLSPLISALKPIAFALHSEGQTVVLRCTLELNHGNPPDADSAIREFAQALLALSPDIRRIWDSATVRRFSIGIAAGNTPHSFIITVRPLTLQWVSALGASIEIAVYAARPAGSNLRT